MENRQFTFTTVSALQMILFGSIGLLLTIVAGIYLGALLIPENLKIKYASFEILGYLILSIPAYFVMLYFFSFAAYNTTVDISEKGIRYIKKRVKLGIRKKEVILSWSSIQSYTITDDTNGSIVKILDANKQTHEFTCSNVLEDPTEFQLFSDALSANIESYNAHRESYVTDERNKQIVKGKNFYGSKVGKIYGVFILLLLIALPIVLFVFKLPLTTINILKLIWLYPIGIYMLYRIFKKGE